MMDLLSNMIMMKSFRWWIVCTFVVLYCVTTVRCENPVGKQVLSRTATGDPVISANANEIVHIKDTTPTDAADNAETEAREVAKQLKDTKMIERKRAQEALSKHAEEQAFKNRKEDHRREKTAQRKVHFNDELRLKKEEGIKTNRENERKSKARMENKEKFARVKTEKKLKLVQKKAKVAKSLLRANRKAWMKRVEVEQKAVAEKKTKSITKRQQAKLDADRQKKHSIIVKEARHKLASQHEAHHKTQAQDAKRLKEMRTKRYHYREKARKKELMESRKKHGMEKKDKYGERVFKKERNGKERNKKRLERAKKKMERSAKYKERQAKHRERMAKYREKAQKKQAERSSKYRERRKKEGRKKAEQHKKRLKEQKYKRKRRQALRWCHCSYPHRRWSHSNRWYSCPKNTMVVGWYRGRSQYLNSLSRYKCCHACRPGGQVLRHRRCNTQNWVHSFDRTGWSRCPNGKFITGFYKSSCNYIYCLEYARCCKIHGSRGYKTCRTVGRFGRQNDYAGWKIIDANYFMTGLYRSGGHYLYNIEYPYTCQAYAY